MRIRILGSGAGGGVPQWNCGCSNCRAVRAGSTAIGARTQDSIAVSAKKDAWVLCNASPDLRQQIESFSELHPRSPRHSPISAIILTNGDLDHVLGLFSLRESYPLVVYATEAVWRGLVDHNVLMRTLQRFEGQVTWRPMVPGVEAPIAGVRDEPTGLFVTARAVKGKIPVHLEGVTQNSPAQNVGLWIRDEEGRRAAYVSAVANLDDVVPHTPGLDVLLLDGTFWSSDELSRPGLSQSRAEDMAHLPIGDSGGTLGQSTRLHARRRIYTHINNTNPILIDGSPERSAVEKAGWQIAWDGMEVVLPEEPEPTAP
jgi:pyrroloquinoline quinone biosynthesis protein B